MDDEIELPWEELSKEDLEQAFQNAIEVTNKLHDTLASATEETGYVHQVLISLYPRYNALYDKAESNPSIYPIVFSGIRFIKSLGDQLGKLSASVEDITAPIRAFTNSTGTFSVSSASASELFQVDISPDVHPIPPPLPRRAREEYRARLQALDPALARTYDEVWQIYYGTSSDRCRAYLFMIRQVFDHFFDVLAPDEAVRASEFWTIKNSDKPDQIYRSERIQYAAHNHVKEQKLLDTLTSSTKQIIQLYEAANEAHNRGLLDEMKAEKALQAMDATLKDWIDAIQTK